MMTSPELTKLDVAARLCAALIDREQAVVASETQQSLARLLAMIELRAPFNNRVLSYLGVKRVVRHQLTSEGIFYEKS